MSDPIAFIDAKSSTCPELAQFWQKAKKYINTRLWFQLTEEIEALFKSPDFKKNQTTVTFYDIFENIISPLSKSIDAYKLIQYAIQVCESLQTPRADQKAPLTILQELDTLLTELASSANPHSITLDTTQQNLDATLLLHSIIAYYYVVNKDLFSALDLITQVQAKIDTLTTLVLNNYTHYIYHKTFAFIEHARDNYIGEFSHKLLMLSYLPTTVSNAMSFEEKQQIAIEISLSALYSPSIYTFGEVLSHYTVQQYTPDYLKQLLMLYQKGDLTSFNAYITAIKGDLQNKAKFNNEYDHKVAQQIVLKYAFLYRKLQVIALINFVFGKSSIERNVAYSELEDVLLLNGTANKVVQLEHIVNYAIGCNVIKAQLDSVSETVLFTWVQPRMLDKDQLVTLQHSIKTSVDHTSEIIETFVNTMKQQGTAAATQ